MECHLIHSALTLAVDPYCFLPVRSPAESRTTAADPGVEPDEALWSLHSLTRPKRCCTKPKQPKTGQKGGKSCHLANDHFYVPK